MVIALEFVKRSLLVRPDHVGDVLFGVNVPNARLRSLLREVVADGLEQVRLAEADAAVDEKGVVGNSRIFGNLDGGRPGKLVGLTRDEAVESEPSVEPGAFQNGRNFVAVSRCAGRRARGGIGATGKNEAQAQVTPTRLGGEFLDARGKAFADEFEHKPIRRRQGQRS